MCTFLVAIALESYSYKQIVWERHSKFSVLGAFLVELAQLRYIQTFQIASMFSRDRLLAQSSLKYLPDG